jgi:short-subunit dehydrogenase
MSTPRRIWLTGASSGIGAALAESLLKNGDHLALSARHAEPLEALSERFPGQVLVVAGDLGERLEVREIGKRIKQAWGALDMALLNAGTCEYIDAAAFDATLIERVLRVNLLGTSYCIEAALPLLRSGNRPHLVGVASAVTYLPLPRAGAYGASKAGLRYLLESLRLDLAREGIDVTVINPGFVDTPLTAANDFPMPQRWSAEQAAQFICARLDKHPRDITFPALFTRVLRLLAHLPTRWQVGIGKRLARDGGAQ